jgi:hypothetical protein
MAVELVSETPVSSFSAMSAKVRKTGPCRTI